MIKIAAAYSKKVPGSEQFSSDGVHLNVEIEVPDAVLTDPQQFSATVRRLFAQAKAEVDHQVNSGHGGPASSGNGNAAAAPPNGHRSGPPASPRQIGFLISLAKRVGNLGPRELASRAGVQRLDELSKEQASSMIEEFSGNGSPR